MRITVEFDDDVNELLREEMQQTGCTLSAAADKFIRLGLEQKALIGLLPAALQPNDNNLTSIHQD